MIKLGLALKLSLTGAQDSGIRGWDEEGTKQQVYK